MLSRKETSLSPSPDQHHSVDNEHLYQAIAQEMAKAICGGTFAAGARLPSVRKLAKRHSISAATATKVYQVLEDSGLLETRPRSGYYVRDRSSKCATEPSISRPPGEPNHPINVQIVLRVQQLVTQPGVLSLGVTSDPAPILLPTKAMGKIFAGVARSAASQSSTYSYPYGHVDLRTQIVKCMSDAGCYLTTEDIIVTSGCQSALVLALRAVTKAGDTVAIESPTFVGVPHLFAVLGLKALEIPTHPSTGIDIDALQLALSRHPVKACLLMPSCQSPLGASMPESSKRRLVKLLARAAVPLIEDDVLGDLTFERPRPKPAKAFDQDGNVLYCTSFSKVLGPGLQVGWIAPGRYRDLTAYLHNVLHSMSSPVWQQLGMAEFLAGGSYTRTVNRIVRAYQKRVNTMRQWVLDYFPQGTLVTNPQGGYILWVELPESIDVDELLRRAIELGIGFAPGMHFSPSWCYTHHIRLGCGGSLDWNKYEPAVAAVGKLARELVR